VGPEGPEIRFLRLPLTESEPARVQAPPRKRLGVKALAFESPALFGWPESMGNDPAGEGDRLIRG